MAFQLSSIRVMLKLMRSSTTQLPSPSYTHLSISNVSALTDMSAKWEIVFLLHYLSWTAVIIFRRKPKNEAYFGAYIVQYCDIVWMTFSHRDRNTTRNWRLLWPKAIHASTDRRIRISFQRTIAVVRTGMSPTDAGKYVVSVDGHNSETVAVNHRRKKKRRGSIKFKLTISELILCATLYLIIIDRYCD